MSKETIHLHIEPDGRRLDSVLSEAFADVSRAQVQLWIKNGQVTNRDGKTITQASLKTKVPLDVIIERTHKAPFEPPRAEAKPDNLVIVFEDDYLLVVDKPVGISVHPGAGRKEGTLVNMLLGHTGGKLSDINTQERPGIVHRLDKDTSGLMVVAKTNSVHAQLADALQKRLIKRVYHALVWNIPNPAKGTVKTRIGRDPKNRQRMSVLQKGGKEAITHYTVLKQFGLEAALVECRLETGRTHQIRVHMAHIGNPVISDPLYAGRHGRQKKRLPEHVLDVINSHEGQLLHARELSFTHPVTHETVALTSATPQHFETILTALGQR